MQSWMRAESWRMRPMVSQHILLLLSDGDDNSSQSALHQAIEVAERREVTIYTISKDNGQYGSLGIML